VADNTKRNPQPDNALAVREPAAVAKPEGMTTGQKVAVGAGVTTAAGLAGFGLYKLGSRMGWWGQSNVIVIDENDGRGGIDGKDGRDGADGKDRPSGGGGGSSKGGRATGKPPNISGDPQGYNTTRFTSPAPVRLTLIFLGFKVESNDQTLVPNNKPHPEVSRFQREWNRVIRGIDAGKVVFPANMDDPLLKNLRGLLDEDGIPGKNTLNALEIASNTMVRHPLTLRWGQLVEMAA
jgi:hypothetical protein